jgi:hypothetical protein
MNDKNSSSQNKTNKWKIPSRNKQWKIFSGYTQGCSAASCEVLVLKWFFNLRYVVGETIDVFIIRISVSYYKLVP